MTSEREPILIIDDSPNDGEFAEIILRESGFDGVTSTTRLSDAIEILKADNTIKRVVLDLGGLVRKSDNPLAALNALEAEGFPDLQIVVLTGNKNPALVREIEKRGYQCLTKENALDLVEKSSALPDAIAKLESSNLNLRQNIHVNELFARVKRLETQIDGILLLSGTSNLQSLAIDVKAIESQLNLLYELKDRIAEFERSDQILRETIGEFRLEIKVINTEKNIELLKLLSKAIWLLKLNQKFCNLCVFVFTEMYKMVFENIKIILLGCATTIVVTSSFWHKLTDNLPEIQEKIKTTIENLLR
jgi:CheY-like chemotaxis protein